MLHGHFNTEKCKFNVKENCWRNSDGTALRQGYYMNKLKRFLEHFIGTESRPLLFGQTGKEDVE